MNKPYKIGGQVLDELDALIELVKPYIPTSYLEVGARHGIALRYFVENLPSIKHVTAVDYPGQKWGKVGSQVELKENIESLDLDDYKILLGDSNKPRIIAEASERMYSIVFIDADHTYEGVTKDLDNYGPLAQAFICLHDVNHPPDSPAYGPTKLFEERWGQYEQAVKIVHPVSNKGIGVFF